MNVGGEYFGYTLNSVNTPPLTNSFSTLDAMGQASAAFTIPAGTDPSLAGLVLHHAFVALDLTSIPGAAVVDFASNAVGFQTVP